jgi:hypothetical protein
MSTLIVADPPDTPGIAIVPVTDVIVPVEGDTFSEPVVIVPLLA